jgi:hypothetical protein
MAAWGAFLGLVSGCTMTRGHSFGAHGKVIDERGAPVTQARIVFSDPHIPSRDQEALTDQYGDFSMQWLDPYSDPYGYLLVRQPGYAYSWVAYNASIQEYVEVQIQSDDWQTQEL